MTMRWGSFITVLQLYSSAVSSDIAMTEFWHITNSLATNLVYKEEFLQTSGTQTEVTRKSNQVSGWISSSWLWRQKLRSSPMLLQLPNDLIIQVCSFLKATQLGRTESVCKKLKQQIRESELLWKGLYQRKIAKKPCAQRNFLDDVSWKERYLCVGNVLILRLLLKYCSIRWLWS